MEAVVAGLRGCDAAMVDMLAAARVGGSGEALGLEDVSVEASSVGDVNFAFLAGLAAFELRWAVQKHSSELLHSPWLHFAAMTTVKHNLPNQALRVASSGPSEPMRKPGEAKSTNCSASNSYWGSMSIVSDAKARS